MPHENKMRNNIYQQHLNLSKNYKEHKLRFSNVALRLSKESSELNKVY